MNAYEQGSINREILVARVRRKLRRFCKTIEIRSKNYAFQVPYSPSMPCEIVDFPGFFYFQIGRDGLFRSLVRRILRRFLPCIGRYQKIVFLGDRCCVAKPCTRSSKAELSL